MAGDDSRRPLPFDDEPGSAHIPLSLSLVQENRVSVFPGCLLFYPSVCLPYAEDVALCFSDFLEIDNFVSQQRTAVVGAYRGVESIL